MEIEIKEEKHPFKIEFKVNIAKQLAESVHPMQGLMGAVEDYRKVHTEGDIQYALLMLSRKKHIEAGFDKMYEWLIDCERTLLGTAVRDEAELRELLTQIREIRDGVVKAGKHLDKL